MPRKGSDTPTLSSRVASRLLRPRVLITLALVLFLAVVAPYAPQFVPDLRHDPAYKVDLQAVSIPQGPKWVPADLVKQSLDTPEDPLLTLLEPDLSSKVAAKLQQQPWVARVRRVSAERSGTIQVDLDYRTPVAMIQTPKGVYPVDSEGVLLPPQDFPPQDAELFPHVENVRSEPPTKPGLVWSDPVVLGGAQIAAKLVPDGDREKYWKRFGLARIVGPENAHPTAGVDQMSFELVTSTGSRIMWGKAPGSDALEPTIDQKIGRLQHYLATYGSFDKPQGPYRIDIRGFDAISLYPLDGSLYR